jgi:hypothetical protein
VTGLPGGEAAAWARLVEGWRFAPGRPSLHHRLSRLRGQLFGRRPAPPWRELRPLRPAERWTVYFLFAPDGRISPAQRFTLDRLSCRDARLLVVCAMPRPELVPADLPGDALLWKGLGGFDFSAFALALRRIATVSPGAEAILLNDSVLGPFANLDAAFAGQAWDLAGLTGSAMIEPHVQSYAWRLRDVTPARVAALRPVLPPRSAWNSFVDVVYLQESRLARVAATRMSVGARWYDPTGLDPTLHAPLTLLAHGFPFMKRSLLGKHGSYGDAAALRGFLAAQGHPPA